MVTKSKEPLILYAAGSLAKISVQQEKELASPDKRAGYSTNLFESAGLVVPATFSSKIPLLSVGEASDPSLQPLPSSGSMRNGRLYRREPVEPLIVAHAGGAFATIPTPTVTGNYNRRGCSKKSGDGLATWVSKYPTPRASDVKRLAGKGFADCLPVYVTNQERRRGLATIAYREERGIIPTPKHNDGTLRGNTSEASRLEPGLWFHAMVTSSPGWQAIKRRIEAGILPTPTRWDAIRGEGKMDSQLNRDSPALATQIGLLDGGKLNPEWVEWLMAFPIGWTESRD